MPYYEFKKTISANTAFGAASKTPLKLARGYVTHMEIEFPPGCQGLARCDILDGQDKQWPKNEGGYFASDDHVIQVRERYPLFTPPYKLTWRTWNTDSIYGHTLTLRIEITKPADLALTRQVFKEFLKDLVSVLIGRRVKTED